MDPLDPLGPAMLCPSCGGYALPWMPRWLIVIGMLVAVALGVVLGMLAL
jgi:hypothetical protein